MTCLSNNYFKTNDEKIFHVKDMIGWYIQRSGVADCPDELRAINKHTGQDTFIDWTSSEMAGMGKVNVTDFQVVKQGIKFSENTNSVILRHLLLLKEE